VKTSTDYYPPIVHAVTVMVAEVDIRGGERGVRPFSEIPWGPLSEFRTWFLHCFVKKRRNHSRATFNKV